MTAEDELRRNQDCGARGLRAQGLRLLLYRDYLHSWNKFDSFEYLAEITRFTINFKRGPQKITTMVLLKIHKHL